MISTDYFRKIQRFPSRLLNSYRYRKARYSKYFKKRYRLITTTKIFCIGMNKTGTTSVSKAMKELGFIEGKQHIAEKLIHHWAERDFQPIVRYCKSANFFQDIPFSLPDTFIAMDKAFKNSKYILTIRSDPDTWYRSIKKFDRLIRENENGRRPGYVKALIWNTSEENVLEREILIKTYENHIRSVRDYFKDREDDLLILNLAEEDSYHKLCDFLEVEAQRDKFPWVNKTSDFE